MKLRLLPVLSDPRLFGVHPSGCLKESTLKRGHQTVNTLNTAPIRLATAFNILLLTSLMLYCGRTYAADTQAPRVLLEENFTGSLSPEWFWGLGTWTAKDGVLRGFESGPRRHGPVKMRKLLIHDAVVNCEFRLEGKATFAGIIFNGSQERGHIVHVVMGRDKIRILAHPTKGKTVPLLQEANALAAGAWHSVRIEFNGPAVTATVDGKTFNATHDCIGEEKLTFGLGGDSGGPEGEKAGALEFRKLRITAGK